MVGASPCSEMVNLAPSEVLSTVPAVVFHLLKADDPKVKSVSSSHFARPVSAGQVSVDGSVISHAEAFVSCKEDVLFSRLQLV